jgi:cytoskeletal protein RodZ
VFLLMFVPVSVVVSLRTGRPEVKDHWNGHSSAEEPSEAAPQKEEKTDIENKEEPEDKKEEPEGKDLDVRLFLLLRRRLRGFLSRLLFLAAFLRVFLLMKKEEPEGKEESKEKEKPEEKEESKEEEKEEKPKLCSR